MKKLLNSTRRPNPLFKFDLKMKLSALFILISFFAMKANDTYGQRTNVTLNLNNVTVGQLINEIENTTEFEFVYKLEDVDLKRIVSIEAKKEKISTILNKVFSNTKTSFNLNDRRVYLIKRIEKSILKQAEEASSVLVQQASITGLVVDKSGAPLPGASIVEKGTTNGVTTDFDGNFSIEIAEKNAILVISYIGFETKEVVANDSSTLSIVLNEAAAGLDEVVVIGYGSVRKRDLTGSVSSIKSEEAFSAPVSSLDQAIQGRASGVQVNSINGAPGSGTSIRIRGGNSITAGNEPLYVIDGFIGGGDLNTINPNDIESVEILKDASSTAIYGSRGANGVVLITTKKGKEGSFKVSIRTSAGIQSLPNKVDVQNALEFATFINTADTDPSDGLPFDLNNLPGTDTDWQEVLTRDAVITDHQISVSGGSKKAQYYISGGILSQDGIVRGSDFKRFSLRSNIDNQLSENVKIGTNISLSRSITNNALGTTDLQALIRADPLRPVFDEDGNFSISNVGIDNQTSNLLADAELNTNETISNRVLINTYLEAKIAKDFTFKAALGGDFVFQKRESFIPSTNPASILGNLLAQGEVDNLNSFGWLNENTLNYNKVFGDHSVNGLVGFTLQGFDSDLTQIRAGEIPSDGVGIDALELAPLENLILNSDTSEFALSSFLGRVNYSYKGKYLVTASLRRDGSSRLGDNNQYGTFPSVALAWRISDEDFLQNSKINNLKLRASFGVTGNQGVDPFSTLATLQTGSIGILNGGAVAGAQQGTLPNPELKWETTDQYDVGIEIGLFNSRLTAELDLYYKKTEDLLLDAAVPALTGFSSTLRNVGSLQNRGLDFTISGAIIQTEDFQWDASVNISTFKNEVLELGDVDFITTNELQGTPTSQLIVGEAVGTFVGAVYEGVDAVTGEAIFSDLNGDGVFDPADDLTVIGDANPDFFGGFQNNFRYKNFDAQMFFQFTSGNDIYNLDVFQVNGTQLNSFAGLREGVFSPSNPTNNATIPRIGSASLNRSTSLFIQDGSFLRFRTLQLGYSIPIQETSNITSLRIFATGNNLFLIDSDDFLGFDPDVNSFGTDNTLRGFDNLAYPQNRSFLLGVEISF